MIGERRFSSSVVTLLVYAIVLLSVALGCVLLTSSADQRIMIACKERGFWAMGQNAIACKVIVEEKE